MSEWVILNNPYLLILIGVSVLLCLYEKKAKKGRGLLVLLSGFLGFLSAGVALLEGADLREVAAILIIFMLLNLEEAKNEL